MGTTYSRVYRNPETQLLNLCKVISMNNTRKAGVSFGAGEQPLLKESHEVLWKHFFTVEQVS